MARLIQKSVIVIVLVLSTVSFGEAYDGGTGEPNNPYQISTAAQLNTIGTEPNDLSKCFILTADIDMAAYDGNEYNIIGDSFQKFTGRFDGNYYIISNFTYESSTGDSVGLFGAISSNAKIKNLSLTNAAVTGGNYVGALVGYCYQGTITNCYSTGNVSGINYVGGLIGVNKGGALSRCSSGADVTGSGSVIGGLIGYNKKALSDCYTTGDVSGWDKIGGLTGYNSAAVTRCYSTGNVMGENNYAGGLIGSNDGGAISNCYSIGDVSGNSTVGGLTGSNSKTITNCYSAGGVDAISNVGGLVGENYGAIFKSFWDVNSSGQTSGVGPGFDDSDELFGKTTDEMETLATFTAAGWDFTNEIVNGTADIWEISGSIYPQLADPTYKFGNIFGSRTNTKLTIEDPCGVQVTFILTGGGYGEVLGGDYDQIALYYTTNKSILTISTPKGETTAISSIETDGSLNAIIAKTTSIIGDFNITGSLGTLHFDDIYDGTISIGSSSNPRKAVTMIFDRINGLEVLSDMPIKSITATEWIEGSLIDGLLDAPSVGSITIKGDKKRVIDGRINAEVYVDGVIGSINAADELEGTWICDSIRSITAKYINDADFTLNQGPDDVGKIFALRQLTARGIYGSQILSAGNIGSVTLGTAVDSVCYAGVDVDNLDDVLDLPDPSADLDSSTVIKNIKINRVKGQTYGMVNSNIAAGSILNAYLAYPDYSNSGKSFGIAADYIKSLKIKDNTGVQSYKDLNESADGFESDDLEVRME